MMVVTCSQQKEQREKEAGEEEEGTWGKEEAKGGVAQAAEGETATGLNGAGS